MGRSSPAAHAKGQKFFGSFFQKRTLPYSSAADHSATRASNAYSENRGTIPGAGCDKYARPG